MSDEESLARVIVDPVSESAAKVASDRLWTDAHISNLATLATEAKLELVRALLDSIDNKDFATETTLAAVSTKLSNIKTVLDSLDAKDFATETTQATLATETTTSAVSDRIGEISATPATNTVQDRLKAIKDAVASLSTGTGGRVRIIDDHDKDAQLSAFGILKVAHESILADYRFDSTSIHADFHITETASGGYTFEPGGTGIRLTTGAAASSGITLESKKSHYYQSGRGQLTKISIILGDTGVAGNVREWGYCDASGDNGILFRMDGTTLKLVIRRNSVEVDEIDSADWDIPVTPDANGHLYYIQFEWLGVGDFFIYYDEKIVHTYNFLGTSTDLSIGTPDLPVWLRNENTTNDTDVYMKCGCMSVVMEGGTVISGIDPNGKMRQFASDEYGNLRTSAVAAFNPISIFSDELKNESSDNLRVNGEDPTVAFVYNADSTYDIEIIEVKLITSAAFFEWSGTGFGKSASGQLTNGILFSITANNGETMTFPAIKRNEDLLRTFGQVPTIAQAGSTDVVISSYWFGGGLTLKANTGDNVKMIVRDDLTGGGLGLNYMTSTFYGSRVIDI